MACRGPTPGNSEKISTKRLIESGIFMISIDIFETGSLFVEEKLYRAQGTVSVFGHAYLNSTITVATAGRSVFTGVSCVPIEIRKLKEFFTGGD
jgi:hypothetical protein